MRFSGRFKNLVFDRTNRMGGQAVKSFVFGEPELSTIVFFNDSSG